MGRLADSVLKINGGSISEEINTIEMTVSDMEVGQSFHEPTHVTRSEPEKSQHSTQHTVLAQAEGTDAEQAEQKRVKKWNDRVYSYYVEAAGRRNFIIFIFCLAGLVFGLSFPRE